MTTDSRVARRRRQLLEVGLDILGDPQGGGELTVRAICAGAPLAQRYFYESFTDKDEFAAAVYDCALARVVQAVERPLAKARYSDGSRVGISALVRVLAADRRLGQILFSPHQTNPVVIAKRFESTAAFVSLFTAQVSGQFGTKDGRPPLAAHFIVGGVAQAIGAWLNADVRIAKAALIDELVGFLDRHGVGHTPGR
ncbi:TetR/AcrR family transcriptional regulator [Mycobacterium sp. TNTM28]|uniref:TetR/AcrR family transcriptional regulator n=1 Tax=[Mycobacterium] fortunisiensis TaxID=2600579 RepID=A0ABS6KP61_9MYCO|nr:TetR/AcrR family transcriptional regulator [[Mycobacterium] fortunisiensis]